MGATWRVRGFELDRRLGSGASSEVWRATITSSGDAVALKRLALSGAEQGRRAVAEAAKLRVLDHPHLVRLHDLILHRDGAILVLDLADAGTLADLLIVRGRVTPGEAITAIAPVAAALAHVHAAGITHGDVSPANILFTRGGVPLLADLGVARLTGDDVDAESTPAYVDPLVARGGVPTSHSDVFMLGAVTLHALTGAPLWTAHTGDAALAQASSGGLAHVEGRLAMAGLPPAMADVIRRALTLEPHLRGTAADFALDLRHSGEPVAVELAAGRARVTERSEPPATDGAPRLPKSKGVVIRPADPRSARPVPQPATLTRPRRAPEQVGDVESEPVRPPQAAQPPDPLPVKAAQRPAGGRHAAVPVKRVRRPDDDVSPVDRLRYVLAGRGRSTWTLSPVESAERARGRVEDPARPTFTRPTSTGPLGSAIPDVEVVVGRPAPTRAVVRARPELPVSRGGRSRRTYALGTGVLVALVTATLIAVVVGHGHSSAVAAPVGVTPVHTAAVLPRASRTSVVTTAPVPKPPAVPATTGSSVGPDADRSWPAVLRSLDSTRARAFATRDSALLRKVYVAGPLRSADAASIARLVPPGCGLHGVRTTFRSISTRRVRGSVVMTARSSLPASHLICSGRLVRTVRAVGPTRLAITLVAGAGTVLIADERVLT